jgi:hypothetical protein
VYYSVGSTTWRIGTLSEVKGSCTGGMRDWAHMDFDPGYSALNTTLSVQTQNGVQHGVKTHPSGTSFNSDPTATTGVFSRAYIQGNFQNGGVAKLDAQWTPWNQ